MLSYDFSFPVLDTPGKYFKKIWLLNKEEKEYSTSSIIHSMHAWQGGSRQEATRLW